MHLLATSSTDLDDLASPIDLGQSPGDMAVLSFTDSDLGALAAAWEQERTALPSLRLANLRDLRHPMSVDLWLEKAGEGAKVILVRLLGGLDWWRYGVYRLAATARQRGIRLALLPGDDQEDPRLAEESTLPAPELDALHAYFREGGPGNMRALLRRLAGLAAPPAEPVPRAGHFGPEPAPGRPVVPILFYRSLMLADDLAPLDALVRALEARGLAPAPLMVASLKDPDSAAFVADAFQRLRPSVILTTTAFAGGIDTGEVPVLQAVIAATPRAAWEKSRRGLGAADLAMHVVLPELDGRILTGALSFKAPAAPREALGFTGFINRPEPDRIAMVADRVAALVRLQTTPRAERRIAVLMPDYPGAGGRAGYAVGLDVPASVLAFLEAAQAAGYDTGDLPATPRGLLEAVLAGAEPFATYQEPPGLREAWGVPDGAFRFRAAQFGKILVALPPDRGLSLDRRADYHDPVLPPHHALAAFGQWLQQNHAIVHMGAHGTFEWLPGKAVALTGACFPEVVLGALPVIYPFIVSNPGEAAQAKRRLGAVTLGHLPPPLAGAGLSGPERTLERLMDEYATAEGLDPRRRDRLARLILETAREAGIGGDLRGIDAWLCDLKDLAIKEGLHIYGNGAPEEAAALLAALDGRRIAAGPAGAPAAGRRDVLPTGRNLYTADPRTLPTPTAMAMGRLAADEIIRQHLQDHGEMPRSLVIDLWGSATLRTGGEEIAQGFALLGCRPIWDEATGRVTGVEVLPPAAVGRERVDVIFRISGLFRDLFPTQIALIDAAVRRVAEREESDAENPLAAIARRGGDLARIFGSAPGTYGAGIEDQLATGRYETRDALGAAYLAAASHAFGGSEAEGEYRPGAFAARLVEADLLVHTADDPGRDLLEGGADAAHIGGFAAATGGRASLIVLDTADPQRPRARPLKDALARIVRGRAVNPRFIAGMMRHGPRGAAEFAETVDRLVAFAETTQAVPGALLDAVYDAYLGDETVRAFLLRENSAAARAIAQRFAEARRRGLWHPRRNDIDGVLAQVMS